MVDAWSIDGPLSAKPSPPGALNCSLTAASISTQEAALVDAAVKTKLILDSVDAWLLQQPSPVSKRNRSVLPAVRDRNTLVTTLRGLLVDLGLKRRAREGPTIAAIAAEYASQHTTSEQKGEAAAP